MGNFSYLQSPVKVAQKYWKEIVKPQDLVIDATAGNGHDTLFLLNLCYEGSVIAMDIQDQAISNTETLLKQSPYFKNARLILGSHIEFPQEISSESVRLIVYNLGYLPSGDKSITTCTKTTILSLKAALSLIMFGGAISITCYPGHEEGGKEEAAIVEFASSLPPDEWGCCHHRWINRRLAPSLLMIYRKEN